MAGPLVDLLLVDPPQRGHRAVGRGDSRVHPRIITAVKAEYRRPHRGQARSLWRAAVVHDRGSEIRRVGGVLERNRPAPAESHYTVAVAGGGQSHAIPGDGVRSALHLVRRQRTHGSNRGVTRWAFGCVGNAFAGEVIRGYCNETVGRQLISHRPDPWGQAVNLVDHDHDRRIAAPLGIDHPGANAVYIAVRDNYPLAMPRRAVQPGLSRIVSGYQPRRLATGRFAAALVCRRAGHGEEHGGSSQRPKRNHTGLPECLERWRARRTTPPRCTGFRLSPPRR